jgi:hypothetical protein
MYFTLYQHRLIVSAQLSESPFGRFFGSPPFSLFLIAYKRNTTEVIEYRYMMFQKVSYLFEGRILGLILNDNLYYLYRPMHQQRFMANYVRHFDVELTQESALKGTHFSGY